MNNIAKRLKAYIDTHPFEGGDSDCEIAEVVRTIIAEGRFAVDGDSYIPGCSVESFNEIYGTDYDEVDIDC